MKLLIVAFITLLQFSFASDKTCFLTVQDKSRELCLGYNWTMPLAERKYVSMEVLFWEKDDLEQKLVDPELNFFPYLWMYMDNGVQHGSKALKVEKVTEGRYRLSQLFFIPMRGYWSIQFAFSESKIPQNVKIPNNNHPKTGQYFLGSYLISENLGSRIDFLKFNQIQKFAYMVWNDLPRKDGHHFFELLFYNKSNLSFDNTLNKNIMMTGPKVLNFVEKKSAASVDSLVSNVFQLPPAMEQSFLVEVFEQPDVKLDQTVFIVKLHEK